jgi:hypothetical protein
MPLTIDLGPEVATFPAFDEPQEVGAVISAIDQSRIKHGLPPHQWGFADLLALGVPQPITEKFVTAENLLLRLHELDATQMWIDVATDPGR